MSNTATKIQRCDLSKIKAGDKLSVTYYLEVKSVRRDSIDVKDQNGMEFEVNGKELVEETMDSAAQFTETKTVSRTEAIEILEGAKDTVFTVNFNKLPDEKTVGEALKKLSVADLTNDKAMKALSKDITKGQERTLVGHLVNAEPKMGRSTVVDLEVAQGQHNLRQVDHRTINWIIFKNVKYMVK